MRKFLLLSIVCTMLLPLLDSCTINNSMQCPGFSVKKVSHKGGRAYAALHHKKKHTRKDKDKQNPVTARQQDEKPADAVAAGKGDKKVELALPKTATASLKDEEIQLANDIFKAGSNNKVTIERQSDGKVYVKASSRKDLKKLFIKQLKHPKPAVSAAANGGGGLALASGILGIIAFVMAFGPFVGFLSLLLALLAVIFGILGLGSRLRGWAIVGIILGSITLLVALLFTFLVFGGFY